MPESALLFEVLLIPQNTGFFLLFPLFQYETILPVRMTVDYLLNSALEIGYFRKLWENGIKSLTLSCYSSNFFHNTCNLCIMWMDFTIFIWQQKKTYT